MALVKKLLFKPELELHGEMNYQFHTLRFRGVKSLADDPRHSTFEGS